MNPQFADFSACMYDGHTDPTKFIEFFKISSLVNSWDAAAQLENVTIFLKDKALQLHNDLATKTQISHIYDELKLKCSPRPESQMFAFNTRKIANNETITKYGTELAKLLKGANPGLTAAQSLISIKAQLRVNLPPNSNINLLLQIHKDKALIDLLAELDDAIQVPGNTATSDSSSTLWNDRPTATVKTEPSESHFTNSSQLNDRSRAGQNSNQQSIPRFAGNCNYCGIYGHRYAQCLKRGRDEIQNNNNNRNNSSMQGNYRPPIQNRTTGQNNSSSSSSSSSSSYTPSRNGTNQNNHSRQSQGQQSYNQSNRPNYGYNQHSGTTYNFNNRRPTTQSSNNYTEQNDNGKNDQEDNNQCSYNAQSDQCQNAENNNNSCNNNNNNMQSSAENFNIETTEEFPYFSFHSESSQIEISADLKPVVLDFPFFLPKSLSLEQRTEVFNTEITDTLEQQPPTASTTPDNVNVIEIVQGSRNNTSLNVSIVMASLSDRMTSFNSVALLDNTCPHSFLSPDVICDEVLLSLESRKECHRFISIETNSRVRNIQCFSLIATLITDNWEGSLEFLISELWRHPDIVLGKNFNSARETNSNNMNVDSSSVNSTEATTINDLENLDTNTTISVSIEELNHITSTSTSLLKTVGSIKLFGEYKVNANILIDGGSTHSFVSPKILNHSHLTHLVTPDSPTKQRRNFCIASATQDVKSSCTVTIADIEFKGWHGKYQFTISDKITRNEIVIGRDFLKYFGAIVDHGTDTIKIQGQTMEFSRNSLSTFGQINKVVSFETQDDTMVNQSSHELLNVTQNDSETSAFKNLKINSDLPKIVSITCYTTNETSIPALSQRLVEINFSNNNMDQSNNIFFEPLYPMPTGCLVARSVSLSSKTIFSNVINTLPTATLIEKGHAIGQLIKAVLAESNEDDEYSHQRTRMDQAEQLVSVFRTIVKETDCPPKVDPMTWKDICAIPVGNRLTPVQLLKLRIVLLKNHDAFQWDPNSISRTTLVEHSIDTGSHPPIRTKQYPLPTVAMDQIRAQAAQMLKDGTIRHSHSSWQSPILLIKQTQADGSVKYRFCVDLRKVNAVTARDSYNLPRINETVNKLNGMMFFSNGDIDRAFWQVGVVEKDKCKHAFNVDGTLYEGNVMSFGSMNAPATFQRLMDTILKGLTWKQCLAYIDDILIFSKTFDTHLQHIDEVLTRIKNAGLKLKPSKCSFGTHEVEYLGFKISDQGIQPSQRKVERLLQVKPPKTPALLHSYLCSINFYRQDIPHFGHITSELHDMAASKTRFLTWTDTALRHFSRLQNAFANAPILAFPDFDKTFYIQGDASAKAVGGACLQKHGCSTPLQNPLQNSNNCIFRPNVFFGRKLTKTERRWSATEREMLALVYGYTICYHLVFGRKIVFLTGITNRFLL
jgi:hypothetical protein